VIWIALAALEIAVLMIYGRRAWSRRWWNVLIAADQLLNAWCGGDARETVSARAAKQSDKLGWRALGWLLDKIDPGHMAKSAEEPEYRPGWK
jgi:hypothetical protein